MPNLRYKYQRMNRLSNLCADCYEEFYCDYSCQTCGVPICGCTGDTQECGECREEAIQDEFRDEY